MSEENVEVIPTDLSPIEGANLMTLRDGKLSRLELFFDRCQTLEAAGLRE
jgi:hypothetical protein